MCRRLTTVQWMRQRRVARECAESARTARISCARIAGAITVLRGALARLSSVSFCEGAQVRPGARLQRLCVVPHTMHADAQADSSPRRPRQSAARAPARQAGHERVRDRGAVAAARASICSPVSGRRTCRRRSSTSRPATCRSSPMRDWPGRLERARRRRRRVGARARPARGRAQLDAGAARRASITAIEANRRAYLKCLVMKETLGLTRTRFLLGDFVEYLRASPGRPVRRRHGERRALSHARPGRAAGATGARVRSAVPLDPLLRCGAPCASGRRWTPRFRPPVAHTVEGFAHTLHPHWYQAARFNPAFCGSGEISAALDGARRHARGVAPLRLRRRVNVALEEPATHERARVRGGRATASGQAAVGIRSRTGARHLLVGPRLPGSAHHADAIRTARPPRTKTDEDPALVACSYPP